MTRVDSMLEAHDSALYEKYIRDMTEHIMYTTRKVKDDIVKMKNNSNIAEIVYPQNGEMLFQAVGRNESVFVKCKHLLHNKDIS